MQYPRLTHLMLHTINQKLQESFEPFIPTPYLVARFVEWIGFVNLR